MSPFRRKAVENALVAVLRDQIGVRHTSKTVRPLVAERIDGCSIGELAAAVLSLRYAGKLSWDALELSASMIGSAAAGTSAAGEGGAADEQSTHAAPSGPDDHEDYPGEVNDLAGQTARPPEQPPAVFEHAPPAVVPHRVAVPGGIHKASIAAGARPLPAPQHEPEIARQVREEVNDSADRRRRARSTATVRQPLELKKFGVPDMNLSEAIGSMLSDTPQSIMRAVSRKHPQTWRRCILLGRQRGESPMQALYAALERGLGQLEQSEGVQHV